MRGFQASGKEMANNIKERFLLNIWLGLDQTKQKS
jgi:hypothetical protein